MNRSASELIKRISSNLTRAQQYEKEANNKRELEHLLWASQDIDRLLLQWNDDMNEMIDDPTAAAYAETGSHVATRIQTLVAIAGQSSDKDVIK